MPRHCLSQYLRTFRLAAGLSQADLGALLGVSEDVIGNVERERTHPTLAVVLGCQIVFARNAAELFPALCRPLYERLEARALAFDEHLRGRTDAASRKKAELLRDMSDRLVAATSEL